MVAMPGEYHSILAKQPRTSERKDNENRPEPFLLLVSSNSNLNKGPGINSIYSFYPISMGQQWFIVYTSEKRSSTKRNHTGSYE